MKRCLSFLLLLAALWNCEARPQAEPTCRPGATTQCNCPGVSRSGVQRCSFDRSYSSCDCNEPASREFSGGIWGTIPEAGELADLRSMHKEKDAGFTLPKDPSAPGAFKRDAGPPAPPHSASDVLVSAGNSTLITAFVTQAALVVVLEDAVQLFDREGQELMHWDAPRRLTAAALDGHLLSVADGAIVTTLDLDASLHEVSSIKLVESCQSAAFVSSNRLVCASITTRSNIHGMYVYNIQASKLLSQLDYKIASDVRLGHIPGGPRLLATGIGVALFELNAEDSLALVTSIDAYNPGYSNDVYAFDATHLIRSNGQLLNLAAADCTAGAALTPSSRPCLGDAGSLMVLDANQAFVALQTTDRTLYGLVQDTRTGTGCESCALVRLSLDKPELLSERPYNTIGSGSVLVFLFDAESNRMLFASGDTGRYRVELLSLESM
ncbi:MAG TPA: hypothetical protein VFN67_18840 [Polyangiales bacterium]|nr:hypothetical protein [Polyangiales bacterium]